MWIGVEEFEAVPGLAQSVVVVEGVSFLNDVLFSGILFALLPTLYLVPRLYGKIEPLLGMKPRNNKTKYSLGEIIAPRLVVISIILAVTAAVAEFMSESDMALIEWDADFLESIGGWFIWVSIGVAAVVALITIVMLLRRGKKTPTNLDGSQQV
ncbi:hypothetical protein D3C76_1124710 [compost metagenome]